MKLPVVSGSEAVKAFRKLGYEFDEQHGSHIILRHASPPHRRLSVPNHKESLWGGEPASLSTVYRILQHAVVSDNKINSKCLSDSTAYAETLFGAQNAPAILESKYGPSCHSRT